jgi:hypothetical protein
MDQNRIWSAFAMAPMVVFAVGIANAVPNGIVTGYSHPGAKCIDRETNTTTFDFNTPLGIWDCADGGMVLNPGDEFFVKLIGRLSGEEPVGVTITSGDEITSIGCRNYTTGTGIFVRLNPGFEGFWDCGDHGVAGEVGDTFLINFRGNEASP